MITQIKQYEEVSTSLFSCFSENRLLPVALVIGSLVYATTALLFFMELF